METKKSFFKNLIVMVVALLCTIEVLRPIQEKIVLGVGIVRFGTILIVPFLLILIARFISGENEENKSKTIKDGIIYFAIIQSICFTFRLLRKWRIPK